MALARPWCCPEPRCAPLLTHNLYANPTLPGESWVCFGRMAEPIEFIYDGKKHANDLSHCDYTPLKGVIRWQENEDDWRALAKMFSRALEKLLALHGEGGSK